MKVLNLYSGIGGNRKLWENVAVTAVELNEKIANIYKDFFPDDEVIIGDAHQYLLDNFEKYDFIWASPPCPTHSRPAFIGTYSKNGEMLYRPKYPDMKLYEEILLLKHYFRGKWVVENVISFYKTMINPVEVASHYFWCNFFVKPTKQVSRDHYGGIEALQERKQFNISSYSGIDKIKTLRNCVEPEVGKYIMDFALQAEPMQESLFIEDANNKQA
jgi:DNA (cytosine-5)-methyltransferase 1